MILIIMVLVGVVNGTLAMEALGGGLPVSGSTYTNPLGGFSRPGTPVGPILLNHQGVAMMQHVGPSVAEQQTALILQLQQQVQTLSIQLNQGGQPGMVDFEFLSRYYQDPRAQQSPETGRFPFPRRIISGLPSGGINANNLVLLNYKAFPEWRDLEHAQQGQPDRAGSLLYEFRILMTALSIAELTAAGLESLIKSGAHMGLNQSWLAVVSNTHRTLHYNMNWLRELISARINCIIEFSSRGRDGLVALHHRYFATAERAVRDDVLPL
ncbi:hypothetical protein VaNZ11_008694 [Volvox africanus]|uniref:Uncharacterized protein n=1 Tax=Volvox africanus TaxID=51714 RepID=A0ABQ5S6C2_9CHLO|nr:hypothetical protein VaNZ11_008694 [Volvox africanus]